VARALPRCRRKSPFLKMFFTRAPEYVGPSSLVGPPFKSRLPRAVSPPLSPFLICSARYYPPPFLLPVKSTRLLRMRFPFCLHFALPPPPLPFGIDSPYLVSLDPSPAFNGRMSLRDFPFLPAFRFSEKSEDHSLGKGFSYIDFSLLPRVE